MVADSAGSTTVFLNDFATSGRRRVEARVLLLDPASLVARVLDRERLPGNVQRPEGIHHHRQLVRALGTNRRFGASRMRAVGDAVRMMGDAPEFDPLPTHE